MFSLSLIPSFLLDLFSSTFVLLQEEMRLVKLRWTALEKRRGSTREEDKGDKDELIKSQAIEIKEKNEMIAEQAKTIAKLSSIHVEFIVISPKVSDLMCLDC